MNPNECMPLTADLVEIQRVGAVQPMETILRLEALRRELGHSMHDDPQRCANLAYALENIRSAQDRQLRWALSQLAERQAQIELLEGQVAHLADRLQRVERRNQRRWWPW